MEDWSAIKDKFSSLSEEEKNTLELNVKIISIIINRRKELGLSQRDLAKMSGIKQSAIARLERLEVIPRIDTVLKLIKPLGLCIKIFSDQR